MKFPGYENDKWAMLFDIEEFVPIEIFKKYGVNSMWFIDIDVFEGMVFLREYWDAPIVINDKYRGGKFNYRGYRPPNYRPPGGGLYSQHYAKNAIDHNVVGLDAKEVGKRYIDNWDAISATTFFTTIENPDSTPTWTHIDKRWTGSNELLIVNP